MTDGSSHPRPWYMMWRFLIPGSFLLILVMVATTGFAIRQQGFYRLDAAMEKLEQAGIITTLPAYVASLPEIDVARYDAWEAWFEKHSNDFDFDTLRDCCLSESNFASEREYKAAEQWMREPLGPPSATFAHIMARWDTLYDAYRQQVQLHGPPLLSFQVALKRYKPMHYEEAENNKKLRWHISAQIALARFTENMTPKRRLEACRDLLRDHGVTWNHRSKNSFEVMLVRHCVQLIEAEALRMIWRGDNVGEGVFGGQRIEHNALPMWDLSGEITCESAKFIAEIRAGKSRRGYHSLFGGATRKWWEMESIHREYGDWLWSGHDLAHLLELSCLAKKSVSQQPIALLDKTQQHRLHKGTYVEELLNAIHFIMASSIKARISQTLRRTAAHCVVFARSSATVADVCKTVFPIDPLVPVVVTQVAPDRFRVHVDWPMPATAALFAHHPSAWDDLDISFSSQPIDPAIQFHNQASQGYIDIAWPVPSAVANPAATSAASPAARP